MCVQAASEGIKRNICEKLKRLRCVWRAFNLLNLSSIYFSVCRYFLWSVWFHSIKLVRLSLTWEVGYEEKLMKFYKSCLSNDLDCGWRLSIGNISICIRGIIHVEIVKFNFKLHVKRENPKFIAIDKCFINVTKSIKPTQHKKSWQTASNFLLRFDNKKKCFSSKKSQFCAFFFACMVISQCVAVMMCSNQGASIHEKGVKYVQTMCNKSPIISLSLSSHITSQHSHFTLAAKLAE